MLGLFVLLAVGAVAAEEPGWAAFLCRPARGWEGEVAGQGNEGPDGDGVDGLEPGGPRCQGPGAWEAGLPCRSPFEPFCTFWERCHDIFGSRAVKKGKASL